MKALPAHIAAIRTQILAAGQRPDDDCAHEWDLVTQRIQSGRLFAFDGCTRCGAQKPGGRWFPHDSLPVAPASLPCVKDATSLRPPCEVCGRSGTEEHHYWPKALFGELAERGPKGWLCPECHRFWHDVMAGVLFEAESA